MYVGKLGTGSMKCKLENREQDLDAESAEGDQRCLVDLATPKQKERRDKNQQG
jgi:hypothetical protein